MDESVIIIMDDLIDLLDTLMKAIIVVQWLFSEIRPGILVEKLGNLTARLNV